MNRIATLAESSKDFDSVLGLQDTLDVAAQYTRRSRHWGVPCEAPSATFAPLNYEAGYAYPLVVWLHGRAGNELQLRRVMPHVSMRNYVAAAPRGTVLVSQGRAGFDWRQHREAIEEAESRIFHCVALAQQRFHVHDERIFLVGCGSGGTMALRVAWNHPQRFAGVATLGGSAPTQFCPLRRVNEMRRLPCLIATSRLDQSYPERRVCDDLRLLHAAGCTVALRQYPGGEQLTTAMLADLNHWLMDLVCAGVT